MTSHSVPLWKQATSTIWCVCVCVCDNVQQYVHFTRHPSKFINPVAVAKTSGSCVDDALEKGMIL